MKTATVEERPARGRPRRIECTDAILDATNALLDEVGYGDLHMYGVAERANVGLATIYRRWPSKQSLVVDAIGRRDPIDWLPDTGDPAADLAAGMRTFARMLTAGCGVQFCQSFVASLQVEPEIAEAYREHVFRVLRSRLRQLVSDAVGPDDPFLDQRADLGPAMLFYRAQVVNDLDDPDAAGDDVAALMVRPLR